jgi:hypothetical protein
MIFQHARFQIWNQNQHPFVHSLSDFGYSNDSLPGVTNMESALNYIVAVLYPNAKPAVNTYGDLPLVGNAIGDYRVVNDDGDGKAAGYRWEQREGEASPSSHKIADVDWGSDSILAAWQLRTQDLFVMRYGYDDIDQTGAAVTGIYAGQRIFGGKSANTNMTLSANSGDGTGAQTGFVQVTDDFRPTTNGTLSLGATSYRWLKVWTNEVQAGTLNLVAGQITDSSGAISFDNENLSTTGTVTIGNFLINGSTNKITNSAGTVDFDNENVTTTGDGTFNKITATGAASTLKAGTQIGDFTITDGNIASASATVSFNALNLTTTGNVTGTQANGGNLRLSANALTATNTNGSIAINPDGTGTITLGSSLSTSSTVGITSTLTVTGQANVDNLRLDGNVLSTTDLNGTLQILPNGSGNILLGGDVYPSTGGVQDLGRSGSLWRKLWISGSIGDATQITIADLMTLRSTPYRDAARTIAAQAGDSLFYDGSQWLASAPDTEIQHSGLSGLTTGDGGHTQFVMLAGRAGGQSIVGGTAAGENINLESTSNATKGFVQVKDTLRPFTDAVYTTSWAGTDLGHSSFRWNDVYTVGEFKGLRLENLASAPASSSQKVGRLIFVTGDENVYVDTGTTVKQVGGSRFYTDTSWNGTDTFKDVTVSGTDARLAIWQLKDNVNDFNVIYCEIKATSATNVRITLGSPLPAGSYRLVGV